MNKTLEEQKKKEEERINNRLDELALWRCIGGMRAREWQQMMCTMRQMWDTFM